MKVIDAVQGTPEWLASRAGRVTASMISAVLMKPETAGFQRLPGAARRGNPDR